MLWVTRQIGRQQRGPAVANDRSPTVTHRDGRTTLTFTEVRRRTAFITDAVINYKLYFFWLFRVLKDFFNPTARQSYSFALSAMSISKRVNILCAVWRLIWHVIGYLREESFQAIDCMDNWQPNNRWVDQVRNDTGNIPSTLWRSAILRGHGSGVTQRPSPATRRWWW